MRGLKVPSLLIVIAVQMLGGFQTLSASTTGKIAGKVTVQATGEPVVGANVVIEGTTMGAATDIDGSYYIINVRPGTYSVRVSCIGYVSIVKTGVQVNIDHTTYVDFALQESAVELKEVTVVSRQPLIEKDRTSTRQTFSSGDILELPIEDLDALIETQAGVLALEPLERAAVIEHNPGDGLHLRGGRENETAFLIDGVRVDNPLWGGSGYAQGSSGTSVEQMATLLGTFNAEYGGKMSGVVSLVTREGGERLAGEFRGYTDNFGISKYDRNTFRGELTLSGPVPYLPTVSFFANLQVATTDGRFRGYIIPDFTDIRGKTALEDETGNPLGQPVPVDWKDEWNCLAKMTWQVLPTLKLAGSYIRSEVKQAKYDHEYKYLPYSMPYSKTNGQGLTFRLTHQLSGSMFYDVYGSLQESDYFLGIHPVREKRLLLESGETEDVYGFSYRGGYQNFWVDKTKTYQFGASLTTQLTSLHLVKAGFDVRLLDLFHQWDNAWNTPVFTRNVGVDAQGNLITQTYRNHKTYANSRPKEYAAYVQDKIEFESIGLILNVGLRWERWAIPHGYLEIPELPLETQLLPTSPKDRFSPRLGISYPISDVAAFYCSYGHFYQFPAYKDLLSNINQEGPYPDRPNLQDIGIAMFNPNMKPELSVTYEAGVQVKLMEDISMSVTVFYRELSDLIGVRWIKAAGYVMYDNVDFGNSKGMELTFVKQLSSSFSARVNYALSQTLISSSSPITAAQAIGSPLPFRTFLANWDRTHDLSAMVTALLPWKLRLSLTGQLRSGKPYSRLAEQPNTERMPWYANVNLKLSRRVELFGIRQTYFIQTYNVLNQRNIYQVYSETGRWDDDGDPSTPYAHDANPKRISDGRRIVLGVNVEF